MHIAHFQGLVAALLKGAEGSPRQGILVHRLNCALIDLEPV